MNNVLISIINEYRGPNLRAPCDVIDDVITIKNTYLLCASFSLVHHFVAIGEFKLE